MAELLALQQDFAAALRDRRADGIAGRWLAGDAALVERRLSIYRGNVAATAEKALAGAYPVIRQVVGEEFFGGLAREQLRATPSTSGDLNDYGDTFADFLAGFAPAQTLPYLPALARLEWAVHRASGAADAAPLDPAALAAIPAERQAAIRFVWAPGTALVESAFPLARIWTIHQPGAASDFSVDWDSAEPVLVAREGWQVSVTALGVGDAAFFRQALGDGPGSTLGGATEAALAADPDFALGTLLGRSLQRGHIVGLALAADEPADRTDHDTGAPR